ncbi:MAG: UPF0280 family protein [Syntrophales bacterium]|jgi:ApbE superfamily uncharacterized protein (UPF0280 family)|nr:UPF0280 family protein [Syntrophales bacterium]
MVEPRTYRNRIKAGRLEFYNPCVAETDLYVGTDSNLYSVALDIIIKYRIYIENYIKINPAFRNTLVPFPDDPFAPPIVKEMIFQSKEAGVGPMASVAGAMSHFVGTDLLAFSENVIVENGGDDFIKTTEDAHVAVFAGASPLSEKIVLKIRSRSIPTGVCTSSGSIGHSLSFGRADAVCVVSDSTALADAAATAVCNRVKDEKDIRKALEWGMRVEGVRGILIIIKDKMGLIGDIELA